MLYVMTRLDLSLPLACLGQKQFLVGKIGFHRIGNQKIGAAA